jgi:hypothetical protein
MICGGTWCVCCHSLSLLNTNEWQMEFAQCHIDWAKRNKAAWEEAGAEVHNIQHMVDEYPRETTDM